MTSGVIESIGFQFAIGFGAVILFSVFTAKYLALTNKKIKKAALNIMIKGLEGQKVHMKDPDKVKEIILNLIKGGPSKLQVISDFDNTITRVHYEGKECHSTYAILDSSPLIPETSREKSRKLRNKYYPIEIDPSMTIEEKIPFMIEWYNESHNVLTGACIKKSDFKKMVEHSKAMLRDGCKSFFENLNLHEVPLLIFSAGLGDLVEEALNHFDAIFANMKFISNYMVFDEEGVFKGFKGDLIHMYNKNQNSIHNTDYFEQLKSRTNLILMGDSLGDLDMAEGMANPNAILRIGFLNSKINESLPKYLDGYDIVLTDDQTMDIPNAIINQILY